MAGMQIYVSYRGTELQLQVESSDSIENVKQKIQDETQIEPSRIILKYGGITLEDGFTLADYNIQPEASIRMSLIAQSSFGFFIVVVSLIGVLLFLYSPRSTSKMSSPPLDTRSPSSEFGKSS